MEKQKQQRAPKLMHPAWIALIDVLLILLALGVYAYFYLVRSVAYQKADYSEAVSQTEYDPQDATDLQDFRGQFIGKFTNGDILQCDTMYISDDVHATLICVQRNGVTYYVEDIYVSDVTCLRTALADDTYGRNITQEIPDMAKDHNAICAINGDFYGIDDDGVVIRNGVLYNDKMDPDDDVCVLFYDGIMRTYTVEEFNAEEIMAQGAYQAWCFGPALMDNEGNAILEYTRGVSIIGGLNPRSAIGYYEPGHYCFVTVDGRKEGYSIGMTVPELAQLFEDLGCKSAYNLDGGQTAVMIFGNSVANQPYHGGRKTSDIIYITEPE